MNTFTMICFLFLVLRSTTRLCVAISRKVPDNLGGFMADLEIIALVILVKNLA